MSDQKNANDEGKPMSEAAKRRRERIAALMKKAQEKRAAKAEIAKAQEEAASQMAEDNPMGAIGIRHSSIPPEPVVAEEAPKGEEPEAEMEVPDVPSPMSGPAVELGGEPEYADDGEPDVDADMDADVDVDVDGGEIGPDSDVEVEDGDVDGDVDADVDMDEDEDAVDGLDDEPEGAAASEPAALLMAEKDLRELVQQLVSAELESINAEKDAAVAEKDEAVAERDEAVAEAERLREEKSLAEQLGLALVESVSIVKGVGLDVEEDVESMSVGDKMKTLVSALAAAVKGAVDNAATAAQEVLNVEGQVDDLYEDKDGEPGPLNQLNDAVEKLKNDVDGLKGDVEKLGDLDFARQVLAGESGEAVMDVLSELGEDDVERIKTEGGDVFNGRNVPGNVEEQIAAVCSVIAMAEDLERAKSEGDKDGVQLNVLASRMQDMRTAADVEVTPVAVEDALSMGRKAAVVKDLLMEKARKEAEAAGESA